MKNSDSFLKWEIALFPKSLVQITQLGSDLLLALIMIITPITRPRKANKMTDIVNDVFWCLKKHKMLSKYLRN